MWSSYIWQAHRTQEAAWLRRPPRRPSVKAKAKAKTAPQPKAAAEPAPKRRAEAHPGKSNPSKRAKN